MKIKTVIIMLLAAIIVVSCAPMTTPVPTLTFMSAPAPTLLAPTPTMNMEGDRPAYVNVSDCPTGAQLVIENKGFPTNLIHLCKDERVSLDTGREVSLVTIHYGEGMDCPAGCVYETYVGIITQDQSLIDLPDLSIETDMWGRSPFNEWRTWSTENHSTASHQEVAARDGHYGWVLKLDYYKFTLVYLKSYGNDAKLGKTLYMATGEIFVYLDSDGKEVWDYSRFEVVTKELP